MKVAENVLLSQLTTMRVGGAAKFVITVTSKNDVIRAINFTRSEKLPWLVLGEGSNVIASGSFRGVIIKNQIGGFNQLDSNTFRIGAGERWDSVAGRMCSMNLSGAELLSGIPGLMGGAIVNNISALGQELSDIVKSVTIYDTADSQFKTLSADECDFSPRSSFFKQTKNHDSIIIDATLTMNRKWLRNIHPGLAKQLDSGDRDYSPLNIRSAVIKTRITHLPDPRVVPSAGPFFTNPVVSSRVASNIHADYPDMPQWDLPNGKVRIPAAWLINKCGLRGKGRQGFQVYLKNAAIIANTGNGTANDLVNFKKSVIDQVNTKFGIILEQEPENIC